MARSRLGALQDRGQVLVAMALVLPVIIGAAGLAVDVGMIMRTRTELQKNADAMALAGARRLCGNSTCDTQAETDAGTWGGLNTVKATDTQVITAGVDCNGATTANHDLITVRLTREQPSFLARLVGFMGGDVSACATAKVGTPAAGMGLLPFGFHRVDPYPGSNPDDVCYFYETNGTTVNPNLWGDSCLVKIPSPSESWGSGNSGAVRLDEGGPATNFDGDCNPGSSGADEYEENIEDGSECWYATNDKITPKTGNMKGPTCDAFANRLSGNTDSLATVFGTPDADGVYRFVDVNHPRFGIVPIVTTSGSGSSADITITGFITVYIEGSCSGAGCNGNGSNPACVSIKPVKSTIFLSGVGFAGGGGSFTDENSLRAIKLVK